MDDSSSRNPLLLAEAPWAAQAAAPTKQPKTKATSTALVVSTPIQPPASKPAWVNLPGFPDNTFQEERRRMNPFADINSFSSRMGYVGQRPLDNKGALHAGPIQEWKEMLREGMYHRPSNTWTVRTYKWKKPEDALREAERTGKEDPLLLAFNDAAGGGGGGGQGSARGGKSSARGRSPRSGGGTPRKQRSTSAPRGGGGGARSSSSGGGASHPFLQSRSGGGGGGAIVVRRPRSASPAAGQDEATDVRRGARLMRVVSPFGERSISVQLPVHASVASGQGVGTTSGASERGGGKPRRAASADAERAGDDGSSPFSAAFWRGASPPRERPTAGSRAGNASACQKAASDHALVLARARGRSPTRWGPAGERRLSLATRPGWRPVAGFPDMTIQSERRIVDPFSDINSYASRQGRLGARPLDCKGMNGARPVQQWKEMLRDNSR